MAPKSRPGAGGRWSQPYREGGRDGSGRLVHAVPDRCPNNYLNSSSTSHSRMSLAFKIPQSLPYDGLLIRLCCVSVWLRSLFCPTYSLSTIVRFHISGFPFLKKKSCFNSCPFRCSLSVFIQRFLEWKQCYVFRTKFPDIRLLEIV